MFNFTSIIREYFKELLKTFEVAVSKSNSLIPQCWNEHHCEVEIENEIGGRLVLKIAISDIYNDDIEGEIQETWYWNENYVPEPVVDLFLGADKQVVLSFESNSNKGIMKSYYGGTIL